MIRRQLPAFSPLPPRALVRASMRPHGEAEEALRRMIRDRFSAEDVTLCGSGTEALQLAIRTVCDGALPANRLVAIPAFTCYDVASAVIGANSRAVLYDVDPVSLTPDVDSLARALRQGPAGVVVAPLFGFQPDWDTLRALTRMHGAALIEDAAQSFGAEWRGRPAGGLGDLSVLSFGRGKGWTAVAGGALLGSREALWPSSLPGSPPPSLAGARTLLSGWFQWAFARPALYGIPSLMPGLRLGETRFHPPRPPRPLGPRAAHLALETADAAEAEATARQERAQTFAGRLRAEAAPGFSLPWADPRSAAGYLRLPVLALAEARTLVVTAGRALGVMPGYPKPLGELAPLVPYLSGPAVHAGARELSERLLTVPVHSLVDERDEERIVALLRDTRR